MKMSELNIKAKNDKIKVWTVVKLEILYKTMDILLLGYYIRFSYTSSLIKWNLQLARITIPPIFHIYPISSCWINKLTNKCILTTIFPLSIYPCIFYIHWYYIKFVALVRKSMVSFLFFSCRDLKGWENGR